MKKITSIAAVALFCAIAMTSCKKDYTCTCRDSAGNTTATYDFKKTKKETAEAGCSTWNTGAQVTGGSCSL